MSKRQHISCVDPYSRLQKPGVLPWNMKQIQLSSGLFECYDYRSRTTTSFCPSYLASRFRRDSLSSPRFAGHCSDTVPTAISAQVENSDVVSLTLVLFLINIVFLLYLCKQLVSYELQKFFFQASSKIKKNASSTGFEICVLNANECTEVQYIIVVDKWDSY